MQRFAADIGDMEDVEMEIREWRRLAIQSIAFFVVVFVSGLGFSQRIQQQLEIGVHAEDNKESQSQKTVSPHRIPDQGISAK